jgi:hypothetical protein
MLFRVFKRLQGQANMVSHKLARAAISWGSRYYLDMIPTSTCIELFLLMKCFKFVIVKKKGFKEPGQV